MSQAELYQQLDQWYATSAGHASQALIQHHLKQLQVEVWGQDAVYCGPPGLLDAEMLEASDVRRHFLMSPDMRHGQFHGSPDALPVAPNSLDLLVLAHALELSDHPHQVLREAERVLVGNGRLVLVSFNPWSCYGMRRLFIPRQFPWNRHFYGLPRVRDWLSVLNLEIETYAFAAFRPPVQNEFVQRSLRRMEGQSSWKWNHFGGICCVRARKMRAPITPVRERWSIAPAILPDGLAGAEPTTRAYNETNAP